MKNLILSTLCLGLGLPLYAQKKATNTDFNTTKERMKFEFMQTQDPATGTVPAERLHQALEGIEGQTQTAQQSRLSSPMVVAQPRWLEAGPTNIGGRVRSMLIRPDGSAWVGAVSGGLWKGRNINVPPADWRKVSDRFSKLNISCIVAHPTNSNIVYFSTGEGYDIFSLFDEAQEQDLTTMMYGGGIWKTTDGGATWAKLPCGKFRFINKMAVAHNGDLFVSTLGFSSNTSWSENADSTGILVLKNNAASFNKIASTPLSGTLRGADIELAADSSIYSTVGLNGQDSKIYKIRLNAGIWQPTLINNPLPVAGSVGRIELACPKTNPIGQKVIYAMYENRADHSLLGIYKSINGGTTWTACGLPPLIFPPSERGIGEQLFYNMALTIHPTNANKVLMGAENMFRSDDGGTTWLKISTQHKNLTTLFDLTYLHPDHHNIVWESNDVAYIQNDGGVWRTANVNSGIPNWRNINGNLNITQFNSCAMSPDANSFNFIGGIGRLWAASPLF